MNASKPQTHKTNQKLFKKKEASAPHMLLLPYHHSTALEKTKQTRNSIRFMVFLDGRTVPYGRAHGMRHTYPAKIQGWCVWRKRPSDFVSSTHTSCSWCVPLNETKRKRKVFIHSSIHQCIIKHHHHHQHHSDSENSSWSGTSIHLCRTIPVKSSVCVCVSLSGTARNQTPDNLVYI
mmetsp:Transcript_20704/g.43308  ORF Transcript_20704/g.43308 Transcript_20704/m.43308 type:complete len:177 (+) Transcript_20704:1735-2265(+)